MTQNRIENELIISVTVDAARPSCQRSQQTCSIRQQHHRLIGGVILRRRTSGGMETEERTGGGGKVKERHDGRWREEGEDVAGKGGRKGWRNGVMEG